MSDYRPSVSICLPVYNGENYVREAITSILEQTFEDFELIISDNASTDGTGEICRDAATRDPRVRYYRAEVNRGLAWNHNRAFDLARGRYVAWIGHDDLMGRQYIGRCVEALEKDAGAVLAFAGYLYIDDKGSVIGRVAYGESGFIRETERAVSRRLVRKQVPSYLWRDEDRDPEADPPARGLRRVRPDVAC